MAISNVHDTEFTVGQVTDTLSNGITVIDLQNRLQALNVGDPVAVQQETERCNDRCDDNDIDADLKLTRVVASGPNEVRTISLSFHNTAGASA